MRIRKSRGETERNRWGETGRAAGRDAAVPPATFFFSSPPMAPLPRPRAPPRRRTRAALAPPAPRQSAPAPEPRRARAAPSFSGAEGCGWVAGTESGEWRRSLRRAAGSSKPAGGVLRRGARWDGERRGAGPPQGRGRRAGGEMRSCGRGYGRGRGLALGAMGGRWALGRRMGALPFVCHPRGSALSPAVPVTPSRGRRRPVTPPARCP